MNKTLIALLLLGIVVVAMAGDAAQARMEKMRMKKAQVLAKKERMHLDKIKKHLPATGDFAKRGKDLMRTEYETLRQQLDNGEITQDDFLQSARRLKDEAKRARAGTVSERKEEARKDDRSKRSAKEAMRKQRSDGMKAKTIAKARRGQ